MQPTIYVCGFAFDENMDRVLLIEKNRGPINMAGLWNGIGGKVEGQEGFRTAMAREFKEETGITSLPADWLGFHVYRSDAAIVYYFTVKLSNLKVLKYVSDEMVDWCPVHQSIQLALAGLGLRPARLSETEVPATLVSDLSWLIPMAFAYHNTPLERRNLGY